MTFREPLYIGERAQEHAEKFRKILADVCRARYEDLAFYVIVHAANPANLMDLYPAARLRNRYLHADEMYVAGLADDKEEAIELCRRMVEDSLAHCGRIDEAYLFPGRAQGTDGK